MSSGLTLLDDDGDRPELHGAEVVGWATQSALAHVLGLTPRRIRDLERIGLPCAGRDDGGDGRELRYPLPHAIAWSFVYSELSRDEVVQRLEPGDALRIHDGIAAEEEARATGRLRTRPRRR